MAFASPLSAQAPADPAAPFRAAENKLPGLLAAWSDAFPKTPAEFRSLPPDAWKKELAELDETIFFARTLGASGTPDDGLRKLELLRTAKLTADARMKALLEARTELVDPPPSSGRANASSPADAAVYGNYLTAVRTLFDFCGKTNEHYADLLSICGARTARDGAARTKWVRWMLDRPCGLEAVVLASLFVSPPPDVPPPPRLAPPLQEEILRAVGASGRVECLPRLVEGLAEQTEPASALRISEAIWRLGVHQSPREGSPPGDSQETSITAGELASIVEELPEGALPPPMRQRRTLLLDQLKRRATRGIENETFVFSGLKAQPGDWILVRNPAPYNRFTTLSPGLFTHVGVLTTEAGRDGRMRMVVTEMRERGRTVPASNLDVYLQDLSHFAVLRHADPDAARKMAQAARDMIGNPAEFDLDFSTERAAAYLDRPLADARIRTYCTGFLLLCGQKTGLPQEEFFPVAESISTPKVTENLAKLGMRLQTGFLSPTGPYFARRMQLVAWKEPRYDPRKEVEEGVYDHFALRTGTTRLEPSPDAYQALRQRTAEAAKSNPLLAQALAGAAGVDAETDLVRAAKAVAAIEAVDEVVLESGREFRQALAAVAQLPELGLPVERTDEQRAAEWRKFQSRHPELTAAWKNRGLNLRALRAKLVEYYVAQGAARLDERFFPEAK